MPVQSDVDGWIEAQVPLTIVPAGTIFGAQFLLANPATCPAAGPWSASQLLVVTVQ